MECPLHVAESSRIRQARSSTNLRSIELLTVINSVVVVPIIIILLIKNIFLIFFIIILLYYYNNTQQGCDAVVRMEASSLGYNMACKCGVRIEQPSLNYCAYHNVFWATHI